MSQEKPLVAVLRGEAKVIPPIWLMRQAGRYLPEYRELRGKATSFLDFCYTPELAAEATLQPIRRFDFDAAILFSDILVVPDAMGQKISFEEGGGPKLEALAEPGDFTRLHDFDVERLAPVFETVARVEAALPRRTALIGFCGAPWTVASYMIAGHGGGEQAKGRLFAYRYPEALEQLLDRLVEASAVYLQRQIEAGADAVQLFESWAGVFPPSEFNRWVAAPLEKLVSIVKTKHPSVPVIVFPRGAGTHLPDLVSRLGADAFGLDTTLDPAWALRDIGDKTVFQGNLDPLAVIAGGTALDKEIERILRAFRGHPHIFNLGHGVAPETPVEHVERLVARVRSGMA